MIIAEEANKPYISYTYKIFYIKMGVCGGNWEIISTMNVNYVLTIRGIRNFVTSEQLINVNN